jgi:putative acyl-CoA dehydrogenase
MEDHIMARLYREAPVNSIWEGSGNVQCIDLLRALAASPETIDVLSDELAGATGAHPVFDAAVARLREDLARRSHDAFAARQLVQRMALLLQASVLIRHHSERVAASFVASRLASQNLAYGSLTDRAAADELLARFALPD